MILGLRPMHTRGKRATTSLTQIPRRSVSRDVPLARTATARPWDRNALPATLAFVCPVRLVERLWRCKPVQRTLRTGADRVLRVPPAASLDGKSSATDANQEPLQWTRRETLRNRGRCFVSSSRMRGGKQLPKVTSHHIFPIRTTTITITTTTTTFRQAMRSEFLRTPKRQHELPHMSTSRNHFDPWIFLVRRGCRRLLRPRLRHSKFRGKEMSTPRFMSRRSLPTGPKERLLERSDGVLG